MSTPLALRPGADDAASGGAQEAFGIMVVHRIVGFALVCGLGLTAACGGGSGSTSASQGASSEPTPSSSGAAASGDASAGASCMHAFTTLQACGTAYDMATFLSTCSSTPAYESCLATTDLDDCSAVALCNFKDVADKCGGTAGVPAGSESCSEVASCQGTCVETNGGDACTCACDAKLSPAKAVNLLIYNDCALEKCPSCGGGSGGDECVTCFKANCAAEASQCDSN